METINIIFTIDNNYAQFLSVTLCSIFENKKCKNKIDVYVLDGGIKEENKKKLMILAKKYSFKIYFIEVDSSFFIKFKLVDYFTPVVYYRLAIPNILPSIEKALYLDCDIVVINDLLELYNINIDNYLLGAVDDCSLKQSRNKDLNIPEDMKYFNAGVILMNLKKWREFNISEKAFEFLEKHPENIKYCDQDALNAVAWGRWLELPSKYNLMTSPVNKKTTSYFNLDKNVLIIHYTESKPWNYLSNNFLSKIYFYYLKKIPWKSKKYINKNFKNIILKLIKFLFINLLPNSMLKYLRKIKSSLKIKF